MTSAFGAACDDEVDPCVVRLIKVRERAHLSRGEDAGIPKPTDRAHQVSEADRYEVRSQVKHCVELFRGA